MEMKEKREIIVYSVLAFIGLIVVGLIIYHDQKEYQTNNNARR